MIDFTAILGRKLNSAAERAAKVSDLGPARTTQPSSHAINPSTIKSVSWPLLMDGLEARLSLAGPARYSGHSRVLPAHRGNPC